MVSVTIELNESAFRSAQQLALERGISVEALVANLLATAETTPAERKAAITRLLDVVRSKVSDGQGEALKWSREDLYEDALRRQ